MIKDLEHVKDESGLPRSSMCFTMHIIIVIAVSQCLNEMINNDALTCY